MFDNFDSLHPSFRTQRGNGQGRVVPPLHDGALKYYKEAGLM